MRDLQLTYRADQRGLLVLRAALLYVENDFGGGSGGVLAHAHRGGAGMAGDALELDNVARTARNRGDDADRQVAVEQHRTLFDVDFDVAQQCRRIAGNGRNRIDVMAGLGEYVAHADAVAVGELKQDGVELADHGFAAEEGTLETHAFFFREGKHFKVEGQSLAFFMQMPDDGDGQQYAFAAIVLAAVAHGVVVRAGQ